MVSNLRLGNRADGIVGLAVGGGVVGGQDGGDGSDDGADFAVHFFGFRLVDNGLESRALLRVGRGGAVVLGVCGDRNRGVLG